MSLAQLRLAVVRVVQLTLSLAAFTASASVAAQDTKLFALYADNYDNLSLRTIDLSTRVVSEVGPLGLSNTFSSMTSDGAARLWVSQNNTLSSVNTLTGASTKLTTFNTTASIRQIAFDSVTGELYGAGRTNTEFFDSIYKLGFDGSVTYVGYAQSRVQGLAFDSNGTLYGAIEGGFPPGAPASLATYNTQTGKLSLVGQLESNTLYALAVRPQDNQLFTDVKGSGYVQAVDKSSAAQTFVVNANYLPYPPYSYSSFSVVDIAFASAVPEPDAIALLLAGCGIGLLARRRSET